MVYPIRRQRSPHPYRANTFPSNPRGRNTAGAGRSESRNWQPALMKGVNGVSKTLGNVQQVLGVVQSTTPIIQQYGPMVKNIPAMYRMLKAFKDAESSDSEPSDSSNQDRRKAAESKEAPAIRQRTESSGGKSTPKLFF